MLRLPKKTYSRRKKLKRRNKSILEDKVNLQYRRSGGNFNINETLPDDIWKDSFDKLKDLKTPIAKKKSKRNAFPLELNNSLEKILRNDRSGTLDTLDLQSNNDLQEVVGSKNSSNFYPSETIVSTPIPHQSTEKLVCPISPLTNKRVFFTSSVYDSSGKPIRTLDSSSAMDTCLLESPNFCVSPRNSIEVVQNINREELFEKNVSKRNILHRKCLRRRPAVDNSNSEKPPLPKLKKVVIRLSRRKENYLRKPDTETNCESGVIREVSLKGALKDDQGKLAINTQRNAQRWKSKLNNCKVVLFKTEGEGTERVIPSQQSKINFSKTSGPLERWNFSLAHREMIDWAGVLRKIDNSEEGNTSNRFKSDVISKQSIMSKLSGEIVSDSVCGKLQQTSSEAVQNISAHRTHSLEDITAGNENNGPGIRTRSNVVNRSPHLDLEEITIEKRDKAVNSNNFTHRTLIEREYNDNDQRHNVLEISSDIVSASPVITTRRSKAKYSTKKKGTKEKVRNSVKNSEKCNRASETLRKDNLPERISFVTIRNKQDSVRGEFRGKPENLSSCEGMSNTTNKIVSSEKNEEICYTDLVTRRSRRTFKSASNGSKQTADPLHDPSKAELSTELLASCAHERGTNLNSVIEPTKEHDNEYCNVKAFETKLKGDTNAIEVKSSETTAEISVMRNSACQVKLHTVLSSGTEQVSSIRTDFFENQNDAKENLDNSIDRNEFLNILNNKVVSFNDIKNKLPKHSLVQAPKRTLRNSTRSCLSSGITLHETHLTEKQEDEKINKSHVKQTLDPIVLPPGKWRKSLSIWRRNNSITTDNIDESKFSSARSDLSLNKFLMPIFCEPENCDFSIRNITRTSSFLRNNAQRTILDYSKLRPVTLEEKSFDTTDDSNKPNALLLETTDDESPNLSKLSIFDNTFARQNPNITLRRSKSNRSERKSRDSNEISNERIQRYQQQLSVPLYRQPSISRRRRTSIVEGTLPKIIGSNCDTDVLFAELVRIAPYEISLRSQLSSRDIVLRRCGQSQPLSFADEYSAEVLHQCRKIGEGVYGEVFMNKSLRGETIVFKIIPIEGSFEVNGEPQKRFDEILSEIVIAMELSCLRNDKEFMTCGFVEVKKVRCVQGRYPDHLIDLWELYRENCGTENDHPEIFPDDQLYIVLELANGGQDLEAFTFQNALQSYSAFIQIALTLAVAEHKFQFEHRDLHWGNILLAPTDKKELVFRINGKETKIPTHGVKATIIDYTLSRMIFDGCCLYNDLSNDIELFSATGDYQFDIYRLMKKRLEDQWERFEPYTNVLWLHYTIDKMISGARYRCSKSKKHRSAIQDMMQLRDELLDFKSASDYVECLD